MALATGRLDTRVSLSKFVIVAIGRAKRGGGGGGRGGASRDRGPWAGVLCIHRQMFP